MKNSLISFILIFSVSVSASQDNIREGLKNILPDGAVIELIEPSPIPGIYAVYYGDLQPIYVTQDGSFFIYGDIYKININSISNPIKTASCLERMSLNEISIPIFVFNSKFTPPSERRLLRRITTSFSNLNPGIP